MGSLHYNIIVCDEGPKVDIGFPSTQIKEGKLNKAKSISESKTILSEVMMPIHANHYGSVHGGTILRLADEAAFVVATKHARKNVVMASMDHIVFEHPVNIGDILTLKAQLCYVGRSSMEVEVQIETEKLKEGKVLKVGSAHLTMVALDEQGRPAEVPKLILKTAQEKQKSRYAFLRRKKRLLRPLKKSTVS